MIRLILFLYPWLELWSLIQLGIETNALIAIGYVFLGFFLGGALLKRVGMSSMNQLKAAQEGRVLHQQLMADDVSMAFAALLFIIPGLISDVLAVVVLVGPLRRTLLRAVFKQAAASGNFQTFEYRRYEGQTGPNHTHSDVTIEGEYREIRDPQESNLLKDKEK